MSVRNESYKINEENLGGVFYPSVVDILQLNRMVSVEIDKVVPHQRLWNKLDYLRKGEFLVHH